MRHIAFIPLLIIMLLTSGCTQNNGEIDPWFGTWRLESLTCDGEPSDDYHGQMTWSFQNNIICLVTDLGHHSYTQTWGTWAAPEGERKLLLDFDQRDDINGTNVYTPPSWLGFDGLQPTLTIVSQSSREMTLKLDNTTGSYLYCLKKIY